MDQIANKTILVTGGNAGVGLELVRLLAPKNTVIVVGRQNQLSDELKQHGAQVEYVRMDLSEVHTLADIFQNRLSSKKIDILVNNAAIQVQKHFREQNYQLQEMIDEININLTSLCLLTKLTLDQNLRRQTPLDIINISSGLALVPKKSSAIYCATKAAITSLTISLRLQLQDTPCRVYQALLPLVQTKLSASTNLQTKRITSAQAAQKILEGYQNQVMDHYIGQVGLLYWLRRLLPSLAQNIMGKA